LNDSHAVIALI